jgi:hypothetical protein
MEKLPLIPVQPTHPKRQRHHHNQQQHQPLNPGPPSHPQRGHHRFFEAGNTVYLRHLYAKPPP